MHISLFQFFLFNLPPLTNAGEHVYEMKTIESNKFTKKKNTILEAQFFCSEIMYESSPHACRKIFSTSATI